MEILELIRIDFDSFENHSPRYETSLGMFAENKDLHTSPQGTLSKYLENFTPVKIYKGYDDEIYPKFKVKVHIINI